MLAAIPDMRLRRIDIDLLGRAVARYLERRGFLEVRSWAQRSVQGEETVGYLLPNACSEGEARRLENELATPTMLCILGLQEASSGEWLSVGAVLRIVASWRLDNGGRLCSFFRTPRLASVAYIGGVVLTSMQYVPVRHLASVF